MAIIEKTIAVARIDFLMGQALAAQMGVDGYAVEVLPCEMNLVRGGDTFVVRGEPGTVTHYCNLLLAPTPRPVPLQDTFSDLKTHESLMETP
ncbi:MAG: hypothetical protein WCT01_00445 [Candidatus Shapirobacteria bacterium]